MNDDTIGFIGAGAMAGSLMRGLLAQGRDASSLLAADIDPARLERLEREHGIAGGSSRDVAERADILVLAVKPRDVRQACADIAPVGAARLVVSVVAGAPLARLARWLGGEAVVVRCMPNTPALVGRGAAALFADERADAARREAAAALMGAVGLAVWVEREEDLDAVTAVSGSGPAYFLLLMEAMEAAAREMGLEGRLARDLVLHTAAGAAELALAGGEEPAALRRRVTSPGGTTEAALRRLEAGGFDALMRAALHAARTRARELGRETADGN